MKAGSTRQDVVQQILTNRAKNIVVLVGAGISTPSGIPDFRTPGTGLYDNLRQYNIPDPQAIFDIDFFQQNPRPFYTLAKELYPGKFYPNYVHYFLRLLHEKGVLSRVYTQNIDGLERIAGVPTQKLVEAHGSFRTAMCAQCQEPHNPNELKQQILNNKLPRCQCKTCWGLVKPGIVFFGEDLPRRFYLYLTDCPQADLILIMGTSLEVEPFGSIVDMSRHRVPRVLFNKCAVGPFRRKNRRPNDVVVEGDIVHSIRDFVQRLGWTEDLDTLIKESKEQVQETLNKENETIPRIDSTTTIKETVAGSRMLHSAVQDQWRHLGSRANSKQQPMTTQHARFERNQWCARHRLNDASKNLLFPQSAGLQLPQVPTNKLPGFNSQKSLHRTNVVETTFRFRVDSTSSSSSSNDSSSTDPSFSSGSDDE